ncbi:MAG: hypothetical protein GKR90_03875 [Pseudomonadales bacterium]|nr:hypothetical protein [Pseudomonadales bacterium]
MGYDVLVRLVGALSLSIVAIVSTADTLVDAAGVNLVRGHCSACHSIELVTSQRGDRKYWLDLIRWMQKTQNLWEIPAEHETQILDYLGEHYTEAEWGRRPNLSSQLIGSSN